MLQVFQVDTKNQIDDCMSAPLISVIVPVYHVEAWLERCVNSIRNQTYCNLEIVLVDDGSPDKCGEICDRLAFEDNRIKVFHRKNGGLSAARNTGLDHCEGDFVGFVDSDDVIHPEMYSRLYRDVAEYGTKLAFCQPLVCYDSEVVFPSAEADSESVSSYDVMRKSLSDLIWFSAWTKLYHRSLFEGLRFPEGRVNEDYPITMRIYDRCDRIVVNHNKLYAYCKRRGSITTTPLNERSFDQVLSAEEVHAFIRETHPEYSCFSARILLSSCLGLLLKTDGAYANEFEVKRNDVFDVIHRYFPEETRNPYLSFSQKALLTAAFSGKCQYAVASWIYRLLKRMKIKS